MAQTKERCASYFRIAVQSCSPDHVYALTCVLKTTEDRSSAICRNISKQVWGKTYLLVFLHILQCESDEDIPGVLQIRIVSNVSWKSLL